MEVCESSNAGRLENVVNRLVGRVSTGPRDVADWQVIILSVEGVCANLYLGLNVGGDENDGQILFHTDLLCCETMRWK